MFIVGFLSWWYGAGWVQRVRMSVDGLAGLYDYFSLDLLLRTLFSPWRQIAAGKVRGSISMQFRAWLDRLFSRCIGAVVRTIVIVIGIVTLTIGAVLALLAALVWPIIPLAPIIGLVLMFTGWIPWQV